MKRGGPKGPQGDYMPITINPPIPSVVHWRQGEEAAPLLDLLPAISNNILYKGKTVKEALDELFEAFAPPIPERGWQKFTETGEFTVPEGVTRVLVLCIAAGSSTMSSNHKGKSILVSRYLGVTPGESIPVVVGVPQAKGANPGTKLQSAFNETALIADWSAIYHVDGTSYTYANGQSPAFPPELDGKGMCTVAHLSAYIATSGTAGPGAGGYAVAADVPDERVAWLELARDMPPGTSNNGRSCYPDTSQTGTAASGNTAGNGANYGGCAGRYKSGQGYPTYAGTGGAGLVCVFWGDDIEKAANSPSSTFAIYRKEDNTTINPLDMMTDASLIPYINEEAGLAKGSTVADALDLLYARLDEKKENA